MGFNGLMLKHSKWKFHIVIEIISKDNSLSFDSSLLSIHGLMVWIYTVLYQTLPNDAIKTGHYITSRGCAFEV